VTEAAPRVDLSFVAEDPAAAALLRQAADLHGGPIFVTDPAGRVLASFGGNGAAPPSVPPDEAAARARGFEVVSVEVYDSPVGHVAAGGPRALEAARFGAGLVWALATRQYETESLSQSLLAVFEEVNLFYGITARLHSVSTAEGICGTILDRACEIVKAARASILLADPHTGVLRIAGSRGMSPEQTAVRVAPGEGITGRVMESGQAILVDDASPLAGEDRTGDARYASRSFLSVPLRVFHPEEVAGAASAKGTRPLGVLNMTDKAGGVPFTAGDLKLLSALASQAAVLLDNTRLAGIEKEMVLARGIQASLLPQAPPRIPGVEVAGICLPARNVGGDYYDMFGLPGGGVGVLVADVSGHNVGAALMMAVSRAAIRAEIDRSDGPEEVLARANRLLEGDLARSELFVSVFLAYFDPSSGTLDYASAGHNPAILRRVGAGGAETLDAEGILFGVTGEYPFARRSVHLNPGDLVFLYTDGFTEARDAKDEMYGEDRLADLVGRMSGLPVAEIPAAVLAEVDRFTGAAPADDRTAVALRAGTMGPAGG